MSDLYEHKFVEEVVPFSLILPIFEIDVDNDEIAKELAWCKVRLSDNPFFSHYEDFKIDFDNSPATKKLCDTIDDIAANNFSRDILKRLQSGHTYTSHWKVRSPITTSLAIFPSCIMSKPLKNVVVLRS